jgi:hypothetical protein
MAGVAGEADLEEVVPVAWLRAGDNAATYPALLAADALVPDDDRIVNELAGFVHRLAEQSAGHLTDGRIDMGTATLIGRSRTSVLLDLAVRTGLLRKAGRGRSTTYELVPDPEFLHIRTRKEIEWDRQQKRDTADPALTVPIRVRDGDACRYCGLAVNWHDRKGGRGGTYDHRGDARTAGTVDTLVVACRACNSGRRDSASAEERYPLRPAPPRPLYGPGTVTWLAKHGVTVPVTHDPHDPAEAAPVAVPAAARPRTQHPAAEHHPSPSLSSVPHPVGARRGPDSRPGTQPDTEDSGARPGSRPDHEVGLDFGAASADLAAVGDHDGGRSAGHSPADLQIPADPQGAGRVGSGRDGPGRQAPPGRGAGAPVGARRGGRGRGGRARPGGGVR